MAGAFVLSAAGNLAAVLLVTSREGFINEGPWFALFFAIPAVTAGLALGAGARWGKPVGRAVYGGAIVWLVTLLYGVSALASMGS